MLARKTGAAPGAKTDKIQPSLDFVQAVARQTQAQFSGDECLDFCQMANASCTGFAKNYKVVHVAAVQPHTQLALDKVVERAEVNQRIKLAQQVADRDAFGLAVFGKLQHHSHKAAVFDLACNLGGQHSAVDAVKELANIELQQVAIGRAGAQCRLRVICGGMGALAHPAGVALVNKPRVENGVHQPVNGVLHNQVTKGRSEYGALFWLVHLELGVGLWAVGVGVQLLVQCIQVGAKVAGKL